MANENSADPRSPETKTPVAQALGVFVIGRQ
jgi:hypothetical protein